MLSIIINESGFIEKETQ